MEIIAVIAILAILVTIGILHMTDTEFPAVWIIAPDGHKSHAFISSTYGDGRRILIDDDQGYIGTGLPDGTISNSYDRWELQ